MQALWPLVLMTGLTLWCTLSTGSADGQPPSHQQAPNPLLHPFLTGREAQLKEDHHQPLKAINPGGLSEPPAQHRTATGEAGGGWAVAGWELRLSSTGPLHNNDVVTVTVSSSKPNITHWIALYAPAGVNVSEVAPAKYAVLSEVDASYVTTGEATVRLSLPLARSTYDVVAYAVDWPPLTDGWTPARLDRAVAVARSSPITFVDENAPCKLRVTLAGPAVVAAEDEDEETTDVWVQWSSGRGPESAPTLHWGSRGAATHTFAAVAAYSSTYDRAALCGPPATTQGYRDIGWIHRARLSGAPPDARLDLFASDATGARTPKTPLTLPPRAGGGGDVRTVVAMTADMGRGTSDDSKTWHQYGAPAVHVSNSLAAAAAAERLHAVFLFGDLSYAQGYASVWDEWLEQVEGFAARVPLLFNLGNHEYDVPRASWPLGRTHDRYDRPDSGGECGVPASMLLAGPGTSTTGQAAMWWARAVGSIMLVSMNTEIDFSARSPQWRFLDAALSSVNRTRTPWVVFAGHRAALVDSSFGPCQGCPMSAGCRCPEGVADPSDSGVADALQREVGPLLHKYKVDVAFWGHNHAYQRSCAYNFADWTCAARSDGGRPAVYDDPPAPVHVVAGTAGADFTVNKYGAPFMEVAEYWFGWVRLTAENATHLRGEFVEAAEEAAGQAGTGTRVGGAVLDEFVVVRGERRRGGEAVRVEEEEVVVLGGEEKEVDDASEVEFRSDGASATRIATSR